MVGVAFTDGPGTVRERIDQSAFATDTGGSTVAAMGFYAKRGSVKPKLFTDLAAFYAEYGNPDPAVTYAHYCAIPYLNDKNPLYALRIAGTGATYGGTAFFPTTNGVVGVPYASAGSPFSADASDFAQGLAPTGPQIQKLRFSAALVTGNTFSAQLVADSSSADIGVVYSASAANTMSLIAASFTTALQSIGSDGIATVSADGLSIDIFSPSNQSVSILNPAVSLGATQATVTVVQPLFYIQPTGPGAYSAGYSTFLSEPDLGTREVITLTIPSAIPSGASVTVTIDGQSTTSVTFSGTSDNTMQLLATAIAALTNVASAVVQQVPFGASNDRTIVITMKTANATAAVCSATPASSFPAPVFAQRIAPIPSNGTFTLTVYDAAAPTAPLETFRVCLQNFLDGSGVQREITEVINRGGAPAKFIRVINNTPRDGVTNIPFNPTTGTIMSARTAMSAGQDGAIPSSTAMGNAMRIFERTDRYPIDLIINAGYTSVTYQQALTSIAANREDGCEFIGDLPPNVQSYEAAYQYGADTLAIDSSSAAFYLPDIEAVDPITNQHLWVPCSGEMATRIAYSDKVRGRGKAPAGQRIGAVQTERLRYEYTNTEMGKLFKDRQINCIMRDGGAFYIDGDTTRQIRQTALSFVSINRMIGYLEKQIVKLINFEKFEPQDEAMANSLNEGIRRLLEPYIGDGRELNRAEVRTSYDAGNTDGLLEQGSRIVQVYFDPKRSARRFKLQSIITRQGATFSYSEL